MPCLESYSYSSKKSTIAPNSIRERSNVATVHPRRLAAELPSANFNCRNAKSLCHGSALIPTLVGHSCLPLEIRLGLSWYIALAFSPKRPYHNIADTGMSTGSAKWRPGLEPRRGRKEELTRRRSHKGLIVSSH